MAYNVTLIPGDGTGPEIMDATRRALEATGVQFNWDVQDAGVDVMEKYGTPLPDQVVESIKRNKIGIKGPITTPVGKGYRSINVRMRKELDLYASIRPVRTLPGVRVPYQDVDLVVVRENTEGLYSGMELDQAGSEPDTQSETFGIRTVTTRLIGASALAPQGSRQFLVNGVPFVFRAGGWSEDLFLRYSAADTANQIALIKNLGLNGIRTEGKQMPDDFYQQMDRAGILVDGGFQCCDAWQLQDSGLTSDHDFAVLGLSALTIGQNLRNHPSVLNFSWSDNNPTRRQEAVSLQGFQQADFQDPLIASAEYKSTPRLGPSGEKEGPYDWVPPGYWYDTAHFDPKDSSRTNVGGAWAFNSEASAGCTSS